MAKRRTTANKILIATAGAATLNLAGCFFSSGNLVVVTCEDQSVTGEECCDLVGYDDATCCDEEEARCEVDGGPDAGAADGGDDVDAGRVDAGVDEDAGGDVDGDGGGDAGGDGGDADDAGGIDAGDDAGDDAGGDAG